MRISDWSSDVCSSDLMPAPYDRVPDPAADLYRVALGDPPVDDRRPRDVLSIEVAAPAHRVDRLRRHPVRPPEVEHRLHVALMRFVGELGPEPFGFAHPEVGAERLDHPAAQAHVVDRKSTRLNSRH